MSTILLVEDSEDTLHILKRAFEKADFNVVTAVDGLDGMDRYKAYEVDIIITDIVMPEMDGIEFIEKIKKIDPFLPIIAISGADASAVYRSVCIILGVEATFAKPLCCADIIQTVSDILEEQMSGER